jgi:hypothetical protein
MMMGGMMDDCLRWPWFWGTKMRRVNIRVPWLMEQTNTGIYLLYYYCCCCCLL